MAVSTVIGARLGHVFFYNWEYYSQDLFSIIKVWEGGLASHGAAIGILIGLWIFVKKRKEFDYIWIVDRIVITVALAGFFIRMGNFMNSEIVGIATNGSFGVLFQKSRSYGDVPRHPVQLYEAFSYLLIFGFMIWRYSVKKASIAKGALFGWFLTLVFGARFIWEYFKVKQVESAEHFAQATELNMGHFLSIPLVIAGVLLLLNSLRKKS
jgi:prolipoprotein diacylglyceryl transferase